MRLVRVRFDRLMKFDDTTTSDEAETDIHGPIELDTEAQIVYIGHMGFPLSSVTSFVRVTEVPCPECKEQFSNNTALGAHRRFAHGVAGKGSKK